MSQKYKYKLPVILGVEHEKGKLSFLMVSIIILLLIYLFMIGFLVWYLWYQLFQNYWSVFVLTAEIFFLNKYRLIITSKLETDKGSHATLSSCHFIAFSWHLSEILFHKKKEKHFWPSILSLQAKDFSKLTKVVSFASVMKKFH